MRLCLSLCTPLAAAAFPPLPPPDARPGYPPFVFPHPAHRDEGRDILIVARTDSRQALGSLDEALWRAAAFADAGEHVLYACT